jgi:predicted aspartyl protease
MKLMYRAALIVILLFCSCATQPPTGSRSIEVSMNQGAGAGGPLIVMLRVNDEQELPFVVDTGASHTVFDKSFEPSLGKRLDSMHISHFGVSSEGGLYKAPKVYLNHVRLSTAENVATCDIDAFGVAKTPAIRGILGMDILRPYCIQLDFRRGKIRFLKNIPGHSGDLGKPFHLTDIGDGCFSIRENLAGEAALATLVDTGYAYDGWLPPAAFERWMGGSTNVDAPQIRSPAGILGEEAYSDLHLDKLDVIAAKSDDLHMRGAGIGLSFLARHLVTLNFPHATMYLKRTDSGRYVDEDSKRAVESVLRVVKRLKRKGQLPGWSKGDKVARNEVTFHIAGDRLSYSIDLSKTGDAVQYHYTFTPTGENGWKLQKAWSTDAEGQKIRDYAVP